MVIHDYVYMLCNKKRATHYEWPAVNYLVVT